MPRRSKSSLGRTTHDAKRKRLTRENESASDQAQRRVQDTERHAARRDRESTQERETRRISDQEQHAARRNRESSLERETRQISDKEQHATRRDRESSLERETRRISDQEQHAARRDRESSLERETRRILDQEQHAARRDRESSLERETRRILDKEQHAARRDRESSLERETRRILDQEQHAARRDRESSQEREAHRILDRQRHSARTARETSEERRLRQRLNKESHIAQLQLQQEPRRSARLERDSARHSQLRINARLDPGPCNEQSLPWLNKKYSGLMYDPKINYKNDKSVAIGQMTVVCNFCAALKFVGEPLGLCCQNGKTRLENILPPPEPLKSLLSGQHCLSKSFMKNVRSYNNAFQMTSFGANQVVEPGYMPTFKVQGQVYHLIGSVLPVKDNEHKFLQMYFIEDYNAQASVRCSNATNLNNDLIFQLQNLLHEYNSYVSSFKYALETLPPDVPDFNIIIHADKRPPNQHERRYNVPSTSEVALLIDGQEFGPRDILLRARDETKRRISSLNRAYDALQYPLIFCRGEDGYSISIPQVDPITGAQLPKKVSCMSFYAYRMMTRENDFNSVVRYGMLTNQFWVDMYAKIEEERLSYIRLNQRKLRAENYIHLQDALRADEDAGDIGQVVILPSSFTAGPRYMHERTQDAITYVRNFGRPDLFITFTCNPQWEEIKANLFTDSTPQDRHDLVSRVFHQKKQKLSFLINKGEIFGPSKCYMYTIEWQKRGLPHAHLLVWLDNKIRAEEIDKIIQAEIPDAKIDPDLHHKVLKHMVHGPCGYLNESSPCMKDGVCSKSYPKGFITETSTAEDGYPKYKRRSPEDGGEKVVRFMRGRPTDIDNRWIVPYNAVLLKVFDAHINVEYCSSVKAIKYVCKYINKGSDQATFSLTSRDEVSLFQSGRYLSSSEAVWRILGFSIHERSPAVIHLAVHLENGQRVYFTSENAANLIANPRDTTLTAFFKLCNEDQFAKSLLYCDVPSYYTWANNKFSRRKQGASVEGFPGLKKSNALGRVYSVHPSNAECFYLRILLHKIKGPTSFSSLRTVEGVEYKTYQEACRALGLLEDDSHWDETLREAALSKSPESIRTLFSIMLTFCQLSNPLALWNSHKENMAEDILFQFRQIMPDLNYNDEIFNTALLMVEKQVQKISGQSINKFGLPVPENENEIMRESFYNRRDLELRATRDESSLNSDQRYAYDNILGSVRSQSGKIFFLDAPGGTGKTFLINLLLAKVRSEGFVAIAVASSGIAATLLDGGRTAHATFNLSLNPTLNDSGVCNIPKQSPKSKLLQECSLIVWDECTMSHKASIESVDRTLQDLRSNTKVMGGVTVLFAGDFRQTLPVIPRGTRADEVNACLKRSYLWQHIQTLSLTINMRSRLFGGDDVQFPHKLLELGNGTSNGSQLTLDSSLCQCVTDVDDLISAVYPDTTLLLTRTLNWFRERAILAPRNDSVADINTKILSQIDGISQTYASIDKVVDDREAVHYPTEFLNSLNPSGMPSHNLCLKVGAPIILLRNLHPPKLCNGTRLQIVKLHNHLIEAIIICGSASGERVLIPRIPLVSSDLPFEFKRIQFPVRLCFAMSINKAQGQTLEIAGVDLTQPCFSHGQLYVACSRVSSSRNLYVLAPNNKTKNVVYPEALL